VDRTNLIGRIRPEGMFKGRGLCYAMGPGASGRPQEVKIEVFRVEVDATGKGKVTCEEAVMTGLFRSARFERNYRFLIAQRVALDAELIEQFKKAPWLKEILTLHDLTGIDFADYKEAERRLNMLIAKNARMTLSEISLAELELPVTANGGTTVAPKREAAFHVFLLPENIRADYRGSQYLLKYY